MMNPWNDIRSCIRLKMNCGMFDTKPTKVAVIAQNFIKQLTGSLGLLPHVRVTKCVLSVNVLVCRLGLVREAL